MLRFCDNEVNIYVFYQVYIKTIEMQHFNILIIFCEDIMLL